MALTPVPDPQNLADKVTVQASWTSRSWDAPHAEVIPPEDPPSVHRPYIALWVGGVRLAIYSPADARALVTRLADATDAFEERFGPAGGDSAEQG